jgi:hypothetical protein
MGCIWRLDHIMRFNIGAAAAAIRKRFYDDVSSRTNTTGSLGVASDGSQWTAVNGTIQVTSGAATATITPTSGGAGSTYPLAIVNLPTPNNVIKIANTNEGSAVALWVQSSSDWWMVNVEGTQVTNTNYAGTTYWSYNYAYQYTQANPSNYVYNYAVQSYTFPSYSYQLTSSPTISFTSGATTFYAVFASAIPYTSANPYTSARDYWSSTPYTASGSTPYTGSTAYSSGAPYTTGSGANFTSGSVPTNYTKGPTSYYKLSNTYYISSASYSSGGGGVAYTAAPFTNYTKGATTYTAGPTTYTAGVTAYGAPYTVGATNYTASATIFYTSGAAVYTSGAATYTVIPPGYSSAVPYTSSIPYTSGFVSGTPYSYAYNTALTNAPGTYFFVTTSGFALTTGSTYYTYASGTTTTYSEYLKIKKSVANTVSEVSSSLLSNAQSIKSLVVSIFGNQITAKGYSDTNFVSQIGADLVYTATGATITTQYGIGVSPSAYNQSAIIGTSVEINRN